MDSSVEAPAKTVHSRRQNGRADSQVDRGWAWVVLLASSIHQMFFAMPYAMGVFNIIFLEVFNKDKQTTAWVISLQSSMISLLGPLSSLLIHHIGSRNTVIVGGLISSIGMMLCSFATTFLQLFMTFGITIGVGNGIAYLPYVVVLGAYFKRYRNLAFGISSASVGLGTMILTPLVQYLETRYGWRGCMLIMSGVYLHLVVAGAMFRPLQLPVDEITPTPTGEEQTHYEISKSPDWINSLISLASVHSNHFRSEINIGKSHLSLDPLSKSLNFDASDINSSANVDSPTTRHEHGVHGNVDQRSSSDQGKHIQINAGLGKSRGQIDKQREIGQPPKREQNCQNVMAVLHNKKLLILLFNSFFAVGGVSMTFMYFPVYFQQNGGSARDLDVIMIVIGICSFVCRLLMGMLTNNKEMSVLLLFISGCGITSIVTLLCPILATSFAGRMSLAFGLGIYGNVFNVLLAPMTLELCKLEVLSIAFSLQLVMCGLGTILGPPFAGWLYDSSGTYVPGFLSAGFFGLLGCMSLMLIPILNQDYEDDTTDTHTGKSEH